MRALQDVVLAGVDELGLRLQHSGWFLQSLSPSEPDPHAYFSSHTAARQPVTPGNAQCRRQRQGTLARAHLVLRGGPPQDEHDAVAPLRYAGDGLVREALPALRRSCNLMPSSYVVDQRYCATGFGAQDCGASKRRDRSQGTPAADRCAASSPKHRFERLHNRSGCKAALTFLACELAVCARTVRLALSSRTPCSAHCRVATWHDLVLQGHCRSATLPRYNATSPPQPDGEC